MTGFEEVETSAGGHAVRRLRSNPATPGNTLVLSIDIRLQALVEELFGDRRGALVAIDPRNGEMLAFVSKPTFDPNLFVDGIDVENWQRAERIARQAAAQPGAARHLSAGLDLQAVHGAGGADTRQAHAAADDLRPGLLQLRQPPLPRRQGRRPRHGRHVQVDRPVVRHLLLHAGQRPGRRRDARLHGAARLRPASPASTSHGELRGTAALDRVEAHRLPQDRKRRSGTPARRSRWASARATTTSPMLQLAQADGRRWPPAASASSRTWCARSRTTRPASARSLAFTTPLEPLPTGSPSTSP